MTDRPPSDHARQRIVFVSETPHLDSLPVYDPRKRCATPKYQTPTRLAEKVVKAKDDAKAEAKWKRDVWARDGGRCRWCKRLVKKSLVLMPDRGEVHHVEPREHRPTRFDRRNGLLVCAACHERISGKVNEKFVIVSSKHFTLGGIEYLDADQPVRFRRVV